MYTLKHADGKWLVIHRRTGVIVDTFDKWQDARSRAHALNMADRIQKG